MAKRKDGVKLMQLECPISLHVKVREIKMEREVAGFKLENGRGETLNDVALMLIEEGAKSFSKKK